MCLADDCQPAEAKNLLGDGIAFWYRYCFCIEKKLAIDIVIVLSELNYCYWYCNLGQAVSLLILQEWTNDTDIGIEIEQWALLVSLLILGLNFRAERF